MFLHLLSTREGEGFTGTFLDVRLILIVSGRETIFAFINQRCRPHLNFARASEIPVEACSRSQPCLNSTLGRFVTFIPFNITDKCFVTTAQT